MTAIILVGGINAAGLLLIIRPPCQQRQPWKSKEQHSRNTHGDDSTENSATQFALALRGATEYMLVVSLNDASLMLPPRLLVTLTGGSCPVD